MKKTLLALTTALTVLPALNAQADWTPPQVYLGTQAGGTFSYAEFDTAAVRNGATAKLNGTRGEAFWSAGIFAGARYFFGNFFGGVEVEGNWDGMNIGHEAFDSRILDTWKMTLKRQWQIIPSAVIGWKMNEKTGLYAKFGAGISKFRLGSEGDTSIENTTTDRVVQFVPALGVEYEVHKNVGVRFEVSGEFFGEDIKGNATADATLFQTTKACYNGISAKLGILIKV
ncbi:MAG TPA: hypothetical protein DD412_02645 [Holosporales bacterium]|nr:hypothetical protein [Holosporales bacterium]